MKMAAQKRAVSRRRYPNGKNNGRRDTDPFTGI